MPILKADELVFYLHPEPERRLGTSMKQLDTERRDSLKLVGAGLFGGIAGLAVGLSGNSLGIVERSSPLLRRRIAFGAGTNLKMMPDASGNATSPMREVFAFTPNYVQCQVEDNPQDFAFDTYEFGRQIIKAHQFYMVMVSDQVSTIDFDADSAGRERVTMRGTLSCFTEAATASTRIGSRIVSEPAGFRAVAVGGGQAGGGAEGSFAITTFFDKASAPLNHSVFGPEPTFTGQMVAGKVTIIRLDKVASGLSG
jgi:hypothetical protein